MAIFLLIVIAFIICRWEGREARQLSEEADAVVAELEASKREWKASEARVDAIMAAHRVQQAEHLARRAGFEASTRTWIAGHAADPQYEVVIHTMGYNLDGSKIE